MGDEQPPAQLESAASKVKPWNFFLSNYANVEEFNINVDEIN
jgi:hypothetical protein